MPKKKVNPSKYNVSNLERGLDVFELLVDHSQGLGVSDIAQDLDIPKNAAFRITAAMHERGYLMKCSDTSRFSLSPKLMSIGYRAADKEGLIEAAMPLLRLLRNDIQETVVLCTMIDGKGLVLDHVPGLHPFRFVVDSGMTFSLHSSAPGKAMLAFMREEDLDALLERLEFVRFNKNTIANEKDFRKALAEVREWGFALDHGEEFEGIHCIAAPVFNAKGQPVAAVNTTGPVNRLTEEMFEDVSRSVVACAEEVSAKLGFVGENSKGVST